MATLLEYKKARMKYAVAETFAAGIELTGGGGEGTPRTALRYSWGMTKDQLQTVLNHVPSWPQERQEEAVRILIEMETYDTSPYRLTDEQLTEVRRRRANKNPKLVSLADARKRFNHLGV